MKLITSERDKKCLKCKTSISYSLRGPKRKWCKDCARQRKKEQDLKRIKKERIANFLGDLDYQELTKIEEVLTKEKDREYARRMLFNFGIEGLDGKRHYPPSPHETRNFSESDINELIDRRIKLLLVTLLRERRLKSVNKKRKQNSD